jgi:hypothetical protein
MANQFYMTLPSNSTFENTAADFITTLPINIKLAGEWEVGLAEIMYANTWNNVTGRNNSIKFTDAESGLKTVLTIPTGRYESAQGLFQTIQKLKNIYTNQKKKDIMGKFEFTYLEHVKSCQLKVDTNKVYNIEIHPDLLYMLGFNEAQLGELKNNIGEKSLVSWHPVDMSCGLNHLYIYCDIVHPQIVGNVLAPLLQIVSIEGKYVDTVNRIYISPHYVPVLKKSFGTINVNVKDDRNESIRFEYGKTIVKLHFRRILE